MKSLTKMEQINLLAFIKTMINKDVGENIKKDIVPIYFKLEKEFKENGRSVKRIRNIKRSYTKNARS